LQIENSLAVFCDWLKEGIILVDRQGIIRLYNRKAREIFGLGGDLSSVPPHPGGRILPGDIVIIADNALGIDDGNLDKDLLEKINISAPGLHRGDAVLAMGVFMARGPQPPGALMSKALDAGETLKLGKLFAGVYIDARIDPQARQVSISLKGHTIAMDYYRAVGHMVVLDGTSKAVKFCQSNGYTARQESIGQLLRGGAFLAKGETQLPLQVVGRHLLDTHSDNATLQEVLEAAAGKAITYESKPAELNGFPTLCTLIPLDQGEWQGALLKVEDISDLDRVIGERDAAMDAAEEMSRIIASGDEVTASLSCLAGDSSAMGEIRRIGFQAARTTSTVLLTGESGTGKSVIATAIHQMSKRSTGKFVQVNCGAIPPTLVESELFGYEKGAFTGANPQGKPGYFELAQGGTIFLDEIGELDLASQVKLLQVLQNRCLRRLGSKAEISVNVRVIAATNRDLIGAMRLGKFREDLYYRLNVFPIHVPPLRERKEDIYSLALHIMPILCSRLEVGEKEIAPETFYYLLQYDWPGNIRELENVLERSISVAEGRVILPSHLPGIFLNNQRREVSPVEGFTPRSLRNAIAEAERSLLADTMNYYQGNKILAREALEMGKTNFYEKLKLYGLLQQKR